MASRARDVRVRQFINQRDPWPALQHGIRIHILERLAAVFDLAVRQESRDPWLARWCRGARAVENRQRRHRLCVPGQRAISFPIRLGARPEITVLELRGGNHRASESIKLKHQAPFMTVRTDRLTQ